MISYQTDPGPDIHIASHDSPTELPSGALDSWGPCQLQFFLTAVLSNIWASVNQFGWQRYRESRENMCNNQLYACIHLMEMSSEESKFTFN